ncbi:MAG: hypothetical protein ABR497_03940 [Kiritimatiellia bacterium]|nr:hypothetical protein [Lentisphaerota bacterium]
MFRLPAGLRGPWERAFERLSASVALVQRHWITKIFFRVRHPTAIKTDEFGLGGQPADFIEISLAGQNAQMGFMIVFGFAIFHDHVPVLFIVLLNWSGPVRSGP